MVKQEPLFPVKQEHLDLGRPDDDELATSRQEPLDILPLDDDEPAAALGTTIRQEQLELPELDDDELAALLLPDGDGQTSLEEAESLVRRARQVSKALFKAAHRMPEYKRALATRERCAQFEAKLLTTARRIDAGIEGTMLPPDVLQDVVTRLAEKVAAWEHSPDRQRQRQKKQVQGRRRKNRGRDLQIVRAVENGESQRRVAARFGITRGTVENVLRRDAPHLLKRRKRRQEPGPLD